MKTKTVFHLHIDAQEPIGLGLRQQLGDTHGMRAHDFSGHPDGYPHFEPADHLTRVFQTSVELHTAFAAVTALLGEADFTGYVEAEVVPTAMRWRMWEKAFDSKIPKPALLRTQELEPGQFRESEVHITFDADRSNQQAVTRLLDSGYFGALLQKQWGTCMVLSVQGTTAQIQALLPTLKKYLVASGGLIHAKIKVEQIVDYWLSSDDVRRPPVLA